MGGSLEWERGEWQYDGAPIVRFDAFVVRRIPKAYSLPALDANAELSYQSWFQLSLMQRERASLIESCLYDLERAGKRLINPPSSFVFDLKPHQLATFQRAGLPIPETLITARAEEALSFEAAHRPAVMKPVEGGATARPIDRETLERLDVLPAPSIFQRRIEGTSVRVTVVGDQIASAVEIPSSELDYRESSAYRAGRQRYVPCELDAETQAHCLTAARLCRHALSGIDLIRRPSGEHVLIEANSAPSYLDIEQKTAAPITDAILDLLER